MIQYYRIPQKKGTSKDDTLFISEQYELKDAIHNGKLLKARNLEMKNSNINDQTLSLLWTISQPMMLVSINLSENFSFITDKAIEHICQCINLQNLKVLNLADDSITDEGISKLAACSGMAGIQELVLYGNSDVTSESLVILGESPWVKKLKKLDLHATSIDDQGVSYFVRSENASKLQELNFSMNWKRISDITILSIAQSKTCSTLESLNLQDCSVTSSPFQALADSPNAQHLHTLVLNNSIKQTNNQINDQLLEYIAYAKFMRRLKVLELRNTQVSSKGIRVLAASLSAESLEVLRLSYCSRIDHQVLLCLKSIMQYQSFKKVYLNNTKVSKEACEELEKQYEQINVVF